MSFFKAFEVPDSRRLLVDVAFRIRCSFITSSRSCSCCRSCSSITMLVGKDVDDGIGVFLKAEVRDAAFEGATSFQTPDIPSVAQVSEWKCKRDEERLRLGYLLGRKLIMASFSLSSGEWEVESWQLVVRNGQYFSLNLFLTLTPNLFPTLPLTLNLTNTAPNPKFNPLHSPLPAHTVVTHCSGVTTAKEQKRSFPLMPPTS